MGDRSSGQRLLKSEKRSVELSHLFESLGHLACFPYQASPVPLSPGTLDFLPGYWSRHGWPLATAEGIDTHGGFEVLILAPVNEHPAGSQLTAHVGHDKVGVLSLELFGPRAGEFLGGLEGRWGVEGDVDVDAL